MTNPDPDYPNVTLPEPYHPGLDAGAPSLYDLDEGALMAQVESRFRQALAVSIEPPPDKIEFVFRLVLAKDRAGHVKYEAETQIKPVFEADKAKHDRGEIILSNSRLISPQPSLFLPPRPAGGEA